MLDVHAPHEPVHGWRDFLLHIATITIGLLIALGLEAAVEAIHHRHIVAEARENIRHEIADNRSAVATDLQYIARDEQQIQGNMTALRALRDNPNAKVKLSVSWHWEGPKNSAWLTARDTRALTLMSYSTVQGYADLYAQQQIVDEQGRLLIRNQTSALVPINIETDLKNAQPSEIDEALHRSADVIVQLQLLADLLKSLDGGYASALHGN